MTRPTAGGVRIAIGGRYLDEVRIRQAGRHTAPAVAYLSFPAERHWAHIDGDGVTISAQAQSVVMLFADGVLPSLGGGVVTVEVGGRRLGPCTLESVESGAISAVDDLIVLRFRLGGATS